MHIPWLGKKVDLVRVTFEETLTRGEFAEKFLPIGGARLSTIIKGNDTTAPGEVTDETFRALCKSLEHLGISEAEAGKLWQCAGWKDFAEALVCRYRTPLTEILSGCNRTFEVRHEVVDPGSIGMIAGVLKVSDSVAELNCRDGLKFTLDVERGKRLVVLVGQKGGWHKLAPHPGFHEGLVRQSPERFPNIETDYLTFEEPFGLYHFVFIEVPKTVEPALPKNNGIVAFSNGDLAAFSNQLTGADLDKQWRWSEAWILVHDNPAAAE